MTVGVSHLLDFIDVYDVTSNSVHGDEYTALPTSARGSRVLSLVEKVIAYVTHQEELLVFEQPDFPEAGVQVPGGTLEPYEDRERGVLRETLEETGLDGLELVSFLGTQGYTSDDGQAYLRHYFHLAMSTTPRRAWDHWEQSPSSGEPPILFRFRWVHAASAPELAGERDVFLDLLSRVVGHFEATEINPASVDSGK
jgi:ADP-ribose pyrophosphatase YjhB (NUDIX family)